MTRLALAAVGAAAGLALFALLALRLRPRVGPTAGLVQAGCLSLFFAALGLFLGLRSQERPPGEAKPLVVLAEAAAARLDPAGVRREISGVPAGTRVRLALYQGSEPASKGGTALPDGPRPEASFSSLEAALAWAALEARTGSRPEVLVVSRRPVAPRLQEGLTVTGIVIPAPARRDRVGQLRVPPRVFPGRTVMVRAALRLPKGDHVARLSVDGVLRETRSLKGEAERTGDVTFSISSGREGVHTLLLELVGEEAGLERQYGEYLVRPFPRLGYVGPGGPLPRLLASVGYPIEEIALERLGTDVRAPAAEVLILEDLPAARLPWPAISALSRAAAWEGRGLLFVGGPHSLADGGYRDAPVERLLPVTIGIRDPKEEKHRTALIVVLDTSWSMLCPPEGCAKDSERMWGVVREERGPRVTKIDLARQALLELLPAMKVVDSFGILGVRTAPYWELEPGVLADPAVVEERVRRITASGSGILLYSALLEASRRITPLDAEIKHILVLLDTDDIDEIRVLGTGTVEELVAEMGRQRVSVSFVGFGFSDDRYVPLLHQLATSTGGSLYLSSDVTSIPRFLREDREGLAGRQAIRRHLATRHDETELPGVEATAPVEGVFVTEAKADTRTVVWTELGYPLVALRRIERGNVGAFMSDGGREMAPEWGAPAAQATWDAVIEALLPREEADTRFFLSRGGSGASIWWRSAGRDTAAPTGRRRDPEGASRPVSFREEYPGLWRADLGALSPGSHQVAVTPAGEAARSVSLEVPQPAAPPRAAAADLLRFAPPPATEPIDGRILPLILVFASAGFLAYELVREKE